MDAETETLLRQHKNLDAVHTDLQPASCVCATASAPIGLGTVVTRPPQSSGNACFACGGITVQTGSCTTCTECGTTGGCG